MGTQRAPNDVKIIAQFLAEEVGASLRRQDHREIAFKLRQHLEKRGSIQLTRKLVPAAQEVPSVE